MMETSRVGDTVMVTDSTAIFVNVECMEQSSALYEERDGVSVCGGIGEADGSKLIE